MDVKRFLEDNRKFFTESELDQVNAKFAMHAVRGDEPLFVIHQQEIEELPVWVLTFDDCPSLWLNIGVTCTDVASYANKYQMSLVRVDKEYRH